MNVYIKRTILKKQDMSFEEREDFIAVEKKLRISLNGKELIRLSCTPVMIKELVVGLFLTEGVVKDKISPEEIRIVPGEEISVDISVAGDIVKGMTTGNFEKVTDDFSLKGETFQSIFTELRQKSESFRLTGCFHNAALSDGERILVFAEDIGRHNAVDKVIGCSILSDISFQRKLLAVSCRLSSGIISKCARWGIPIVASRSAPTDLAVEIAEASGITLVGFVRGDRLSIYTHPQRIRQ